jgi:fimbrial chaperone protein
MMVGVSPVALKERMNTGFNSEKAYAFGKAVAAWRARIRRALAAAFLSPALLWSPAGAVDLLVNPARIDLSQQRQTVPITLKNDTDKAKTIQVQTVAWLLRDGSQVETPTTDLQVSPSTLTIAPKSEQVIRASLKRPPDAARELSYRIYLRDTAPQAPPGSSGIRISYRTSLPVFVQPALGATPPKLLWTISRPNERSLKLVLKNEGRTHVQVINVVLHVPGREKAIGTETYSSYILSQQSYEWSFKIDSSEPIAGGRVRLAAKTDAGNVDTELVVAMPR